MQTIPLLFLVWNQFSCTIVWYTVGLVKRKVYNLELKTIRRLLYWPKKLSESRKQWENQVVTLKGKSVSLEHTAKSRKSKGVYVHPIVYSFTYPCVSNSPPMIRANMIAPIITPADIAPIWPSENYFDPYFLCLMFTQGKCK